MISFATASITVTVVVSSWIVNKSSAATGFRVSSSFPVNVAFEHLALCNSSCQIVYENVSVPENATAGLYPNVPSPLSVTAPMVPVIFKLPVE